MSWHEKFRGKFGHLVPAGGIRRIIFIALMIAALSAAVGAGMAFSLMTPSAANLTKSDPTPSGANGTAAADRRAVGAANSMRAAVGAILSPLAGRPRADDSCSDQTWPYLDGKCLSDTNGKPEGIRMITRSAPEPALPPAALSDNRATGLADQTIDGPKKSQKTTQVRRSKKARDLYNNSGATSAGSHLADREGAYRDRGWSW